LPLGSKVVVHITIDWQEEHATRNVAKQLADQMPRLNAGTAPKGHADVPGHPRLTLEHVGDNGCPSMFASQRYPTKGSVDVGFP